MSDDKKQNWIVEYEIPLLQAIYRAPIGNCTEAQARALVAKKQPRWRIRKIVPHPSKAA